MLLASSDDSTVAAAIEANMAAFLMEMGDAGGGEQRSTREIEWTAGGSPIDYHNAVVRARLNPDTADAAILEVTDRLRFRRVPGTWHLSPSMAPPDLEARLAEHGWSFGGEEPAMAADLRAFLEQRNPDGLTIARVEDRAGLGLWARTLARGFGEGEREAFWARDVFEVLGYDPSSAWTHLVAFEGAEAVGTATLFLEAGVAGLYFVMTVPEQRRQGIGAAVTRAAMLRAREQGYEVAVLASSEMGYRLYEALGFRELFRYRLYEWRPA